MKGKHVHLFKNTTRICRKSPKKTVVRRKPLPILVVDNNEGVCGFIEAALRQHAFTVFVASNGRIAIDLFREQPIDIVLMDVEMPHLSGPETLEILQSIRPDVPCFFMTASGGLTKERLKGGINVFEKPFRNFSEVVGIFSEILDKRGPIKYQAHAPGEAHQKLHENGTRVPD